MAEIENLKIDGGATYTVGNQDIVANEWEASKTYVKDKSYVTYEHGLYVCNTTHTSVSPIDLTKWTAITVGEAIAANTTAIGSLSTLTTTDKSSIVGAVNEVNKLESVTISTSGAIANLYQSNASKQNKLVVVNLNLSLTSATSLYALLCTMSKKPLSDNQIFLHSSSDNGMYECHFGADGKIQWWNSSVIPSGATIGGQIVYFTND